MTKGIILAGGTGSRLFPLTKVVSKQLMPLYDKPMIYYPLATLMQAGIREILIITTPYDQDLFIKLLGDGSSFGISLSYAVQERPEGLAQSFIIAESFLNGSKAALILGDNLFYGHNLQTSLRNAFMNDLSTIFAYHVSNPSSYGVIEFDSNGRAISIYEKPQVPKSNYAVPGIYFFDSDVVDVAKNVLPSERGELEITSIIEYYLNLGKLNVEVLGRGTAWLDTGTHDDLLAASQFIYTIEKRQGLKVNCPEEVAYRNGWLSSEEIEIISKPLVKSGYGKYLLNMLDGYKN